MQRKYFMPKNMFKGFKRFVEEYSPSPPDPDKEDDEKGSSDYLDTVKKQLGVPKKLWLGMPLLLSNTKLGDHMIKDPTMFYVSDFDDSSVTLTNVPKPGYGEDAEDSSDADDDDPDNEIDLDKETIKGKIEITIDREDFNSLQEPQGMDAAGAAGGGMGMGGGLGI